MNKRKAWGLIPLVALIAASAACSAKNDGNSGASSNAASTAAASGSPEAKNVVFDNGDWVKDDDKQLPQYEAWKTALETEYPNIKMTPDYYPYDVNTFLPKAESGQLPNLFSTYFTEPDKIINAGYAADITSFMTKYGYDKAVNPDMLKLVTRDGKIYGIPDSGYYMGIWYNVNLFKQAGLLDDKGVPKFPRTYDELAQTAKIIKDKTGKFGFFFPTENNQGGWQFMNIAWSYGAEFEQQEGGKWKAVFDSPEAVEALQYIKDLKWKYDVLPDNALVNIDDGFRMFGTDQVGMAFATTDWKNNPVNDYKMSKDAIAMSAVPAGPKARVALFGGNLRMFANNASPEQIDAGFKWTKIIGKSPDVDPDSLKGLEDKLASDQSQNRVTGVHGLSPWVNKEKTDAENAIYDKYRNVNLDLWNDYMKNEGVTIKPEVPMNAQELYKQLDSVIQAVLTDKNADPKTLLDKATADFQKDYLDKAN